MNTEPIRDFIITNERNLRIAAAVAEAWPEAREHLANGFLSRLGEKLKKSLPGWTVSTWNQLFVDKDSGWLLTKPEWKAEYSVELYFANSGKNIFFGVSRAKEKDSVRKRGHSDKILNAVKKHERSATAREWWEAKMAMRFPASDWQKPEILWRMHKDEKFLDEVAEQLLTVAKAGEPHIDDFYNKQ